MTVSKFKVGDRVFAPFQGYGTVVDISHDEDDELYPISVKWDDINVEDISTFTSDGHFWHDDPETAHTITLVGKIEDAVNPSHYQVAGIPEAIEIMQHLMTKEQLEGFLWGNIIKYAYRYGRKGDKAETAGKIAWYANQLKAVEERGDGE